MAENCAAEEIVNMIFNKYIGDLETVAKTKFIEDVWTLVREEFQTICSRQILDIPWFRQQLAQLFDRTDVIPVQVPLLKKIVTYARYLATQICQHDKENRLAVEQLHEMFLDHLLDYSMQQQYLLRTNLTYSNFLISNINKDMMINSNDEEKKLFLHRQESVSGQLQEQLYLRVQPAGGTLSV